MTPAPVPAPAVQLPKGNAEAMRVLFPPVGVPTRDIVPDAPKVKKNPRRPQ